MSRQIQRAEAKPCPTSETEAIDKALAIILQSGGVDGAHHKQWVLDQVVRALTACPVERIQVQGVHEAMDYEYFRQGESEHYREWVRRHNEGEDGPDTYQWGLGTAP